MATTVHNQQRDHRYGYHAVHQPANNPTTPLRKLTPNQRRRIDARIRALDQLAGLMREVPFGSGWAA